MSNIDFSKVVTVKEKEKIAQAQLVQLASFVVSEFIENTARDKGYDSATQLLSYTNSTVLEWKAEALAFSLWRDNVWTTFFKHSKTVGQAKSKFPKEPSGILALLPQIEWPK